MLADQSTTRADILPDWQYKLNRVNKDDRKTHHKYLDNLKFLEIVSQKL